MASCQQPQSVCEHFLIVCFSIGLWAQPIQLRFLLLRNTQAFLDEIFKANSAILNSLLTILNERKFDNGAGSRVSCPLKCVIGASNELPDSQELDALLDRFLLRSYVTSGKELVASCE